MMHIAAFGCIIKPACGNRAFVMDVITRLGIGKMVTCEDCLKTKEYQIAEMCLQGKRIDAERPLMGAVYRVLGDYCSERGVQ